MGVFRAIIDNSFMSWLMADEQEELFEHVWAVVLNVTFLGLAALVLWPVGRAAFALTLGKGFWVFWCALYLTVILVVIFRRVFRVDMDTHFDAYVLSAVAASAPLQAGWSAFAALAARETAGGSSLAAAAVVYFLGLLSCWIAFGIVSTQYGGTIYRRINLPLGVASFAVFCVWPAAGRTLFGWFFDLSRAWFTWLYGRFW